MFSIDSDPGFEANFVLATLADRLSQADETSHTRAVPSTVAKTSTARKLGKRMAGGRPVSKVNGAESGQQTHTQAGVYSDSSRQGALQDQSQLSRLEMEGLRSTGDASVSGRVTMVTMFFLHLLGDVAYISVVAQL